MNKARQAPLSVVVCIGLLGGSLSSAVPAQAQAIDLDAVEASITAPDSSQARETMQAQIASLRESSARVLSRKAALETSSAIYLSHNRSLLEEAFYHLEQIVPYAHVDERLYLRKLQSLKANKERFDEGAIGRSRFEAEAQRADRVYAQEREEAREYLADKAARLSEICDNLGQNVEALRENLDVAAGSGGIPRALTGRIMALRANQAWLDFTTPTETGREMRRALEQAPDGEPQAILACLSEAFAAYEVTEVGVVIEPGLVEEIVGQSQ